MRRRARRLRRSREVLLLELGALVFEAERRSRRDPALVSAKVDRLRQVDQEAGALAAALREDRPLVELVSQGIAGPCVACGELLATDARFCSNCGTPTSARARRDAAATGAAATSAAATSAGQPGEQQPGAAAPGAPPGSNAPQSSVDESNGTAPSADGANAPATEPVASSPSGAGDPPRSS